MTECLPLKVGEFDCVILQDKIDSVSLQVAFPEVDVADLAHAGIAGEDFPFPYVCLYVDTGAHNVLIDTGNGAARGGRVAANLNAAGIRPDEIDTIVLTHAHSDHYGGLLDSEGNRQYPNAEVVMARGEWEYYSSADYLESLKSENSALHDYLVRSLLELKPHIRLVDEGQQVVPGIRVVAAPGHTAHHIALEVQSADETLLNIGDAWIHPMSVEHPEWRFFRDADNNVAIQTRHALAQKAANGNTMVLGYHFPFPGLAQISAVNGAYRCEMRHTTADDQD